MRTPAGGDTGKEGTDSREASKEAAAIDPIGHLCPIALTQNHTLAHSFFPSADHVLVVQQRSEHRLSAAEEADVRSRAVVLRGKREKEKILMLDVSRGHERKPIPIFNGADEEPAPTDFTCAPAQAVTARAPPPPLAARRAPPTR